MFPKQSHIAERRIYGGPSRAAHVQENFPSSVLVHNPSSSSLVGAAPTYSRLSFTLFCIWSFSTLENYNCRRDALQLEINFVPENNLLYDDTVLLIRRERCG